jgi:uncharacterized protein
MLNRTQAPIATLFAFILTIWLAVLMAAVASPWVQAWLAPLKEIPLHRIFSRLTLLGVIIGIVWLLRHYHLADRQTLGFDLTGPRFLRRVGIGLIAGLALMVLAVVPLFLLDLRHWNERLPADIGAMVMLAAKGLGRGLIVALVEETLFRGALQGALQRQGARRLAIFAIPALYSAAHFIGRPVARLTDDVNAWSGFTVLHGFFASFSDPLRIADAFIALYFVGLLLALIRQRWGDIAGCIGLHAGFVAVILVFRKVSSPAPVNDWSFLVGSFDGLLGLWIAALTGIICVAIGRRLA